MKDERGIYYHAFAGNPKIRVYVRKGADGEVEFRMWDADHSQVWEKHPWLPMQVIRDASDLYKAERNPDANPMMLYDLSVAKALLREAED